MAVATPNQCRVIYLKIRVKMLLLLLSLFVIGFGTLIGWVIIYSIIAFRNFDKDNKE